MTNWTIEAARDRHTREFDAIGNMHTPTVAYRKFHDAHNDRAHLLAEVERLQAKIDELPDEDDVSDLRYTVRNLQATLDRVRKLVRDNRWLSGLDILKAAQVMSDD